ncbi:hypothetical protein ACFZC3_08180 [Streptomyces sp. NPDC007903]|uniref:hypothetical protein n=1 Tax=Streptomyces sp. NPDC007903 TaxID=3364786 RepID=UPI0036E16DCE
MGQPEDRAEGAGPFTTRLTWHLPGGGRPRTPGQVLLWIAVVAWVVTLVGPVRHLTRGPNLRSPL